MPTIVKTVTIEPGESFTLPPGAELIYTSDNSGLTSDCVLPPEQDLNCYIFSVTVDNDDNTGHPMDESDAIFDFVEVLGTQYPMNFTINRSTTSMFVELDNSLPEGLIEVTYVDRRIFDKRNQYYITVRVLESIADTVEFKISGRGYETGAYLKLTLTDDCTYTCPDEHICYDGVTLVENISP